MKKIFSWALMLPLMASVVLTGCAKDEDEETTSPILENPVEGKTMLFEETSTEAEVDVKVYTDMDPYVGYNRIYVMVYEMGTQTAVTDAHVEFMPEMDMITGMMHGSPFENPAMMTSDNGLYEGAVVFVMPSEGNGTWRLGIKVHNHSNEKEGMVESTVNVVSPEEAKMYSFESATDGARIFVSLVEPKNPEVGKNDFAVAIHQKETMMSWPAVEDLQVEIEPEMPTMGHGSPDNVNPVSTGNGHYTDGTVNFTMTGYWKVNVMIKDAGGEVMDDDGFFDITF